MKKIINISSLVLLVVILIGSCKKKETSRRSILAENAVASVLTAENALVKIDTSKLLDKAQTLNWTATDWGFSEAKSTYVLEVAKAATTWGAATGIISVPMGNKQTISMTHKELNEIVNTLGFARDVAADLKARVKATTDNSPDTKAVYSNDGVFKVTPFGTSAVNCATLSQTNATVDVDKANLNGDANKLSWTASDFGYQGLDVVYQLQMVPVGSSWDMAATMDLGPSLDKSFTHLEINDLAKAAGLKPDAVSEIKSRIVAKVANFDIFTPCNSNELITKVTPKVLVAYLWVPGDYQGWSPATAGKLTSALGNGEYEGTIEFVYPNGGSGSNNFKFVGQPSWGGIEYGSGASAGTIQLGGGDINMAQGQGTFDFKVNTNDNTWSATIANWGLIGEATTGSSSTGWNQDIDMKFNKDNGRYELTVNLFAGQFKFRKNDDWGVNFGSTGANDGDIKPIGGTETACSPGGKNFGIDVAGNYTLSLDVMNVKCYVTKN
jgi:starch-binding outer membrane protein SusE/F